MKSDYAALREKGDFLREENKELKWRLDQVERESRASFEEMKKIHAAEITRRDIALRELRNETDQEVRAVVHQTEEEFRRTKNSLERENDEQKEIIRRLNHEGEDQRRVINQLKAKITTLQTTSSDMSARFHTNTSDLAQRANEMEVRAVASEKQSQAVKQALEMTIHEQAKKYETLLVQKHALDSQLQMATQRFESQLQLQKEASQAEIQRINHSLNSQLGKLQSQLQERDRTIEEHLRNLQNAKLELGEKQRKAMNEAYSREESHRLEVARIEGKLREVQMELQTMQQARDLARQQTSYAQQKEEQVHCDLAKLKQQLERRDEEILSIRAEAMQAQTEVALQRQKLKSELEEKTYQDTRDLKAKIIALENENKGKDKKLAHYEEVIGKLSKVRGGDSATSHVGIQKEMHNAEIRQLQQRELLHLDQMRKLKEQLQQKEQELLKAKEQTFVMENDLITLKQTTRGQSTQITRLKQERDKLIEVSAELRAQMRRELGATPQQPRLSSPQRQVYGPNIITNPEKRGQSSPSLNLTSPKLVKISREEPTLEEDMREEVDSSINREDLLEEGRITPYKDKGVDSTLERAEIQSAREEESKELSSSQKYKHPFQLGDDSFPSFKSPAIKSPVNVEPDRFEREAEQPKSPEESHHFPERENSVQSEERRPLKEKTATESFLIAKSRPYLKHQGCDHSKRLRIAQLKQEYSQLAQVQ